MTWFSRLWNQSPYSPHAVCLLLDEDLLNWSILGHWGIFVAYMLIPAQLLWLWFRVQSGHRRFVLEHPWALLLFGAFILLCGLGHKIMAYNYFHSYFWLEATWHMLTAVVSLITALMLPLMVRVESGRHDHANLVQRHNALIALYERAAAGQPVPPATPEMLRPAKMPERYSR